MDTRRNIVTILVLPSEVSIAMQRDYHYHTMGNQFTFLTPRLLNCSKSLASMGVKSPDIFFKKLVILIRNKVCFST